MKRQRSEEGKKLKHQTKLVHAATPKMSFNQFDNFLIVCLHFRVLSQHVVDHEELVEWEVWNHALEVAGHLQEFNFLRWPRC